MNPCTREPLKPCPSISVVIPTFNSAATIEDALESVATQTHPVGEVIVVDDGSVDDTVAKARACMGRLGLPGTVLRQDNAGPAAARNRGIAEAAGEWIAFLDADDAWFQWRLLAQLALAEKHAEVDCWCGQAVRWCEPGVADKEHREPTDPAFRLIAMDDLLPDNMVVTSTVLVRRQTLSAVGGFDLAFRGPEDFDLWLRLAARVKVAFVDASLARYRYKPGSLSLDDRRFLPEALRVLEKAFGVGGVLENRRQSRPLAESTQYWNASWMAFVRGDRRTAVALWWTAWKLNHKSVEPARRPWFRLLVRYGVGRMNSDPATRRGSDRTTGL